MQKMERQLSHKEEKANAALLSIKMGGKLKGVTDKTKLNGPLVIPARVKEIGERAFSGCSSLQEIYFPCTDLREIGKDAFPTSPSISIFATEENTDTIYNLLKQSGLKNLTKY